MRADPTKRSDVSVSHLLTFARNVVVISNIALELLHIARLEPTNKKVEELKISVRLNVCQGGLLACELLF